MSLAGTPGGDSSSGKKFDSGKLRWDLVEWAPIKAFVKVLTDGAVKYEAHNWKKVRPFKERYSAALLRHVVAYMEGEKTDPETGSPHLAHALTNIVFLMWGDDNLKEGE
jgi:hypothetical protein